MQRKVSACMNCGEEREIAAHNLCFRCYRAEERAQENPYAAADRHNLGQLKQIKKLRKCITSILNSLDDGIDVLNPEDVDAVRSVLQPYFVSLAAGLAPVMESAVNSEQNVKNDVHSSQDSLETAEGGSEQGEENDVHCSQDSSTVEVTSEQAEKNNVHSSLSLILAETQEEEEKGKRDKRLTDVGVATATADEVEPEVNSGHANVVELHTSTHVAAENGLVPTAPQTGTGADIPDAQFIPVGTSGVLYLPSILPNPDYWLQSLSALPWTPEKLKRSSKPISSRREIINFGIPYDVNSASKPPLPLDGGIEFLRALLERRTGSTLEQCTCARYQNGAVGIACHYDAQHPLLIASISIGANRQMGFCAKDKSAIDHSLPLITLEHGSLVLLSGDFNLIYKHGILEDESVMRPRISVTFRHFAEE